MTREQFYTYQRQTFDSFSKKVCRNERTDFFREIARRRLHEEELDAMTANEQAALRTEDTYFKYHHAFPVLDMTVEVQDPTLGEILNYIPAQLRDIVLLSYFLEYSDNEIGHLLHTNKNTIHYRRISALRRIKKLMEAAEYD